MNDFVLRPGVPNQFGLSGTKRNLVAPDRRMVSSMAPTIVEDPQGRLFMVVGTPGGPTIITTIFQVIMNVIDHGMDIEEAVTARLVHHQWKPRFLGYEEFALSQDAVQNLQDRGWTVRQGFIVYDEIWGRTQALRVKHPTDQERVFYGGADPRRGGAAVGF
jgi:gamma-glutamyltranspeptidase/glutathione hydrolase